MIAATLPGLHASVKALRTAASFAVRRRHPKEKNGVSSLVPDTSAAWVATRRGPVPSVPLSLSGLEPLLLRDDAREGSWGGVSSCRPGCPRRPCPWPSRWSLCLGRGANGGHEAGPCWGQAFRLCEQQPGSVTQCANPKMCCSSREGTGVGAVGSSAPFADQIWVELRGDGPREPRAALPSAELALAPPSSDRDRGEAPGGAGLSLIPAGVPRLQASPMSPPCR